MGIGVRTCTVGLVSVIIPVFNRAEMLREAVQSVLNQTYRHFEIIIVNDGSTDHTADAVAELVKTCSNSIRSTYQENSGPGAARNRGLEYARGEFIQYLDSDDLLTPKKFESQIAALHHCPEAGLAYGITERVNEQSGTRRIWARTGEQIRNIFPDFLMKRGWDTNAPLWRRSACEAIGPWRELRCMEDWEHDLRAGMLGIQPVHVNELGVIVRDHGSFRASGMNTGFTPPLMREFYHAHELVWLQMRSRGLLDWAYVGPFSRKLFWVARMCGERGLSHEADSALRLASEMTATSPSRHAIRIFRIAVKVLGWPRTVKWTEAVRNLVKQLRVSNGRARP